MIPVCSPTLDGNELKYAMDTLNSGWISSSGKYLIRFEESFAKYSGAKYGIAVCNGTAALHIALLALGIGKRDEVIIPNFTMISSAISICYTGAMPVFVDAEPETWNIDYKKIEEKITKRTKAIMVVHIYGHPCDMVKINEIGKKHNLKIIEDAAEAHGAEVLGKKCGSLGDIAAFSFYANKLVATGEGGMVITNDEELAKKSKYYRNLCFPLDGPRNYLHDDIGHNYRMSNIHAAIGLAQVEKLDEHIAYRRRNNALYRKYLKDIDGVIFQPEKDWAKNVYWMNAIILDPKKINHKKDDVMAKLKEKGVETRPLFQGLHRQKSLKKYGCMIESSFPVSDFLADNGFYLPSSSHLKEEEIKFVCDTLREILICNGN